jgi:hypothetical protein
MKQFLSARFLIISGLLFVPLIVAAQATPITDVTAGINSFAGVVNLFTTQVVKAVSTLFLSLALVAFFFGIAQFIWGTRDGDATKAKNGKQFMLWGMIALFVMFSVYGIIKFGQGILFNGRDVTTIQIPSFNFGTGTGSITGGTAVTSTIAGFCADKADGVLCASSVTGSRCFSRVCTAPAGTATGAGVSYTGSYAGMSNAQVAYNTCIGNSGTAATCTPAYTAAGGTGNPQQNLAQQAYNICIANGNTATECQPAYQAYGGTGSGQQGLANQAYSLCRSNGNSDSACQAAYAAYGGTGTPSTGGTGDNIDAGGGWNPASGGTGGSTGGTTGCEPGYSFDYNAGCVPNSTSGGTGGSTGGSTGAYVCDPQDATCSTSGGDYGPTPDYGGNTDWQTTGNGYDNPDTGTSAGGADQIPTCGDGSIDC